MAAMVSVLILGVAVAQGQPQSEEAPLPPSTNPTNRAIFPSQGQSQSQQLQDQLECYRWATRQTGWDPYEAYDELVEKGYAAELTKEQAQGGLVKGAAGGAAVGALIGAIAGDTGKGAAIGAIAGGLTRGARSRRQRSSADQVMKRALEAYQRDLEVWDRNYSACMEGHGYTVN
jgi:hypothetical protein